ncbi:MAG: AraC family transcriptional regulator [Chloroflexota bacterium]
MATERQPQLDHYERINQVTRYIREHVDEPLKRDKLAAIAGFSVPHFHRIFTAHVGESISQYVRRVRMERAARQLLNRMVHITDVALDNGYETHSAFGKAFKQTFGISPTEFRELNPTAAGHMMSRRILYNRKELDMQPQEIRTLPHMKVLFARTSEVMTGPAFLTAPGQAFEKLMNHVMPNGLMEQVRHVIAIYPDEPEVGKEVRFDAGVIFADGVEPTAGEGLEIQTLSGGKWAIFRHIGSYDTLWKTWQDAHRDWLPTSGHELRNTCSFEDYVDNPKDVAPEELRTDIYIPIQ